MKTVWDVSRPHSNGISPRKKRLKAQTEVFPKDLFVGNGVTLFQNAFETLLHPFQTIIKTPHWNAIEILKAIPETVLNLNPA